ncbi:MAG: sodium:solute symporter family protein, partial [Planctomycetota bacterium]
MPTFSFVDGAIVVVYLLASVAIGLIANRCITGLTGYLVAGRSLGTALAIATMTGSELGLITVMYQAQKGFTGGFAALHIGLIAGIVTLFVGLTGFIVVPLRRARVMTIPEYYQQRFGRKTRILGGILLAVGGILNMGLFLRIGSQFVVGVTGMDPAGGTIIVVMVALLLLVLFYTVLGGMVSVVLTDYLQFVILSLGLVLAVLLAIANLGMNNLFDVVESNKAIGGFDPIVGESGFGSEYVAWQGVLGLVSCAIWPTAVTRALSARDTTVVRRQYVWSSISFMIRFLLPCFLGICAYVFLVKSGDVLFFQKVEGALVPVEAAGTIDHFQLGELGARQQENIEAFPVFLNQLLPVGLLGLVTAAMLAAFMSTHDSYLLCWASVITRDIVAPLCRQEPSARVQLALTRVFIVLIGAYVLFWGLFYVPGQDVWEYLGITGAVYSAGAIAVLTFGLYWRG